MDVKALQAQKAAAKELRKLQQELRDAVLAKGDKGYTPLMRARGVDLRSFLEGKQAVTNGALFNDMVVYASKPQIATRIKILRDVLTNDRQRSSSIHSEATIDLTFNVLIFVARNFNDLPQEPVARAMARRDGMQDPILQAMLEGIFELKTESLAQLEDTDIAQLVQSWIKEDVESVKARLTPTKAWSAASEEYGRLHEQLIQKPEFKELGALAVALKAHYGTVSRAARFKTVGPLMVSLEKLHDLIKNGRALLGMPPWEMASPVTESPPAAPAPLPPEPTPTPMDPPTDERSASDHDERAAVLMRLASMDEKLDALAAALDNGTHHADQPSDDPHAPLAEEMMIMNAVVAVRGVAQLSSKLPRGLSDASVSRVIVMIYDLLAAGHVTPEVLDRMAKGPTHEEQLRGRRLLQSMLSGREPSRPHTKGTR